MSDYIIRGIDAPLWRNVKSKAALEGRHVKKVIEQLLKDWVELPPKIPESPAQPEAGAGSAEDSGS